MKHILALLCISTLLLSSCMKKEGATSETTMKTDSTKTKNIENYKLVTAMFSSGKMDDLNKYIDDNMNEHTPWPGMKQGLAGLKEGMAGFRASFPDLKITPKEVTSDGDWIFAHYNMTGTNTGSFMGMPATGKKIDIDGMELIKLTNCKATDHWAYDEGRKMMEQLGLMPPMDGPHPPTDGKMPPPDMKKGK